MAKRKALTGSAMKGLNCFLPLCQRFQTACFNVHELWRNFDRLLHFEIESHSQNNNSVKC